jgi:hypothetical protein
MKGAFPGALFVLFLVAQARVRAQSGTGDGFDYTINSGKTNSVTITGYIGASNTISFPTNINGLTVTGIAQLDRASDYGLLN